MKTYIIYQQVSPVQQDGPPANADAGDGIMADLGAADFGAAIETPSQRAPVDGISDQRVKPGVSDDKVTGQPGTKTADGTAPMGTTPAVVPATAPVTPDLNAIIKTTVDSTAAALRSGQQQQTQTTAAPKELTPQEFDRKYGIVRPTTEHLTHILGQDPQRAVAALDNLFQANLTAALRMANDVVEAKLGQLQEKLTPHITSWQSHQADIARDRADALFTKDHPDLTNERDTVNFVKDALLGQIQSGVIPPFRTQSEANLAVANATRTYLQKVRGGGQGAGGQQTNGGGSPANGQHQQNGAGGVQNHVASSGRTMATASSAGRTGTGQAPVKSVVDEVFGADAR